MKKNQIDVKIRPLIINDAHTSYKWRNDPRIWENTVNRPNKFISLEDELVWIKKVLNEEDSHRFAIIADNEYVGNIQLTNISDYTSYYGIFIGNVAYWGKGIAKIATQRILTLAFDELRLEKVKLRVRKENSSAFNLYLSVGFKETDRNDNLLFMEISKNDFLS